MKSNLNAVNAPRQGTDGATGGVKEAQEALRSRPDALQAYLVSTRPTHRRRSWPDNMANSWGLLVIGLLHWIRHFASIGNAKSAVCLTIVAVALPTSDYIAGRDADWTARKLTGDPGYQEVLARTIAGKLRIYLGGCYVLAFLAMWSTGIWAFT